jgi:F-type H+-transporting ATPase subunit alpha
MAELTINADDVRNALNEFAASYEPGNAERVEVGRVTTASDGIARVEGLPSVMANELLRFEDGTLGLAQNLDTREIGVVVLGDFAGIEEGQEVHTAPVKSCPYLSGTTSSAGLLTRWASRWMTSARSRLRDAVHWNSRRRA